MCSILKAAGVPYEALNDLQVVVGELCSNAIRHGYSKRGEFEVMIEVGDEIVKMTVADEGCGFTMETLPPPCTERADLDGEFRIGGFGLPLVESLVSSISCISNTPSGTRVEVTVAINGNEDKNTQEMRDDFAVQVENKLAQMFN